MSKRINISNLFMRGNAGFFRTLLLVLAGFVFSLSAQGQYLGGSGGGSSNGDGFNDFCTPVITAKLTTTCSGVLFTVSPTDNVNGDAVPASTTYSWAAPTAISGITGLTGAISAASFYATLTNTTNAPIDVVYIVTPASLSCTGETFTVTVTVYPLAAVDAINLSTCSGVTFAVTPSSGTIPTGISYTWST
ncbi:MAG: PKD-like domain-containing protein, partial [Chitinophagia bacterium]